MIINMLVVLRLACSDLLLQVPGRVYRQEQHELWWSSRSRRPRGDGITAYSSGRTDARLGAVSRCRGLIVQGGFPHVLITIVFGGHLIFETAAWKIGQQGTRRGTTHKTVILVDTFMIVVVVLWSWCVLK